MNAEKYVEIIMQDETDKIVRETPTVYDETRVVREYEFQDGAVVRYEWQDAALNEFNHRFTLLTPPLPNTRKFQAGVIRTIEY